MDTTNSPLFIRELQPASTPKGAFLLIHGMESNSDWFLDLATRLAAEGYASIAYDRIGWGKSPGKRGHLPSYRDFYENASGIASQFIPKYGPLHLAGMSWGGMAALYLALRRPWLFASVSLLAPGLAAKRDLTLKGKFDALLAIVRKYPETPVTPAFDVQHFTANPKWQNFISHDENRVKRVTASFCFETLKMRRFIQQNAGRRLLPPTLCLLAGRDQIVDNPATESLARKAGAVVETFPEAAHSLIFEQPEQTANALVRQAARARQTLPPAGRVWVVGAGAVGGTIASFLSFAGVETGVLVKNAYQEPLRQNGFTVTSGLAQRTARDRLVFSSSPEELPADPNLVVVAVKSFDTISALRPLAGKIPPGCMLASLQNGVGNEDKIGSIFPDRIVASGSICASLELTSPGQVHLASDHGGLAGARHQGDPEVAKAVFQGLLSLTGMECRWVEGGKASARLKWSKLMLNIGFNVLNSLTGKTSAQLLADPLYGRLALSALREGFKVMRLLRLEPVNLPGFPVAQLRRVVSLPSRLSLPLLAWQAGRTPEVAFSMRQDVLHKRQHTELVELNGKIVEVGRRFGVKVTANEKLVEMAEKAVNDRG